MTTAQWTGAYRGMDGVAETFTGKFLDLNNPDPSQICIEDIAHHLAQDNRYCGAACWPVSVAQHSYMVREFGRIAWPRMSILMQKQFMLHDAHEAYTRDFHRPLRYGVPGIAEVFNPVCDRVQAAILEHFGIPPMTPEEERLCKIADNAVCRMEAHNRMESHGCNWEWHDTPLWCVDLPRYDWNAAKQLFKSAWESFDNPKHLMWNQTWPAITEAL